MEVVAEVEVVVAAVGEGEGVVAGRHIVVGQTVVHYNPNIFDGCRIWADRFYGLIYAP